MISGSGLRHGAFFLSTFQRCIPSSEQDGEGRFWYNRTRGKYSMTFSERFQTLLRREPLTLGFICMLALGLRLCNLSASSLWIDEIYSLIVANTHLFPDKLAPTIHPASYFYEHYLNWQAMNWDRLLALLKINVHMPLYYLLVNPWMGWFGNDAIGLRSFSAVCSTLMILPVFWLGKSLGGRRAGYLSAIVAALAPFQIYYGQEGRMYALALFWAALSGLGFWKVLFSGKYERWGWVYALAISGGMLSHYMFVFFLGFQFIFVLFWLFQRQEWKKVACFLPALAALSAITALWLPVYRLQQQGVNDEYHFAKGLVAWSRYLSVPFWQPLVVMAGDNRLARVFYFPLTVLSFLWIAFRPKSDSSRPILQREGYLLAWILLPLLLQIGYDLFKQTHISIIDRYAMLISPAMCLWLGLVIDQWLNQENKNPFTQIKPLHTFGAAVLAGMLFGAIAGVWSPSPFRDEHNKDDNIRRKIRYFTDHARPGDLIFANGPFGAPNLAAYYLNQTRPTQPMVYWINEFNGQKVQLPAAALFRPYQRVWLFRHRANNERGLQTAKNYLYAMYPHRVETHDWFIYAKISASSD